MANKAREIATTKSRAGWRVVWPRRQPIFWALLSSVLLIAAFPNGNLWPLAWVALVPLLIATGREKHALTAFLLGWWAGTVFFLGSCYWLTYAMIRYGGIPAPVAYAALLPPTLVVGLFPGLACAGLARLARRWGDAALFAFPLLWTAGEWLRLQTTGQLWNALGYSQAFVPSLIQPAAWGGVYAVSSLIVTVNVAIAYAWRGASVRSGTLSACVAGLVALLLGLSSWHGATVNTDSAPAALVVDKTMAVVPLGKGEEPMAREARERFCRTVSAT